MAETEAQDRKDTLSFPSSELCVERLSSYVAIWQAVELRPGEINLIVSCIHTS